MLETVILDFLENARRTNTASNILMLGGANGPGGGVGGPPAGFSGKLPQSRVAYDESEYASLDTPSGVSLVTNLDHIRARLELLEASGVGGGGIPLTIKSSGATITTNTSIIDFIGAQVTGVGSTATVTISGGTSGGSGHTIQDEGSTLPTRSKLNFKGTVVVASDNAGNDSTDVTITVTSGTVGHIIRDETTPLPVRGKLSFKGTGVTATDNGANDSTDITITVPEAGITEIGVSDGVTTLSGNVLIFDGSSITEGNPGEVYIYPTIGLLDGEYNFFSAAGLYFPDSIITLEMGGVYRVELPTGSGGGGDGHIIQDEGVSKPTRAKLNFIGNGVTVTDNSSAGSTDVTISGINVFTQDLTAQIPAYQNHYSVMTSIEVGTLRVYVNGNREKDTIVTSMDTDNMGFYLAETLEEGDTLLVDYNEGGTRTDFIGVTSATNVIMMQVFM
jgi:hypothetical protein